VCVRDSSPHAQIARVDERSEAAHVQRHSPALVRADILRAVGYVCT
jgi:hypothetical protein